MARNVRVRCGQDWIGKAGQEWQGLEWQGLEWQGLAWQERWACHGQAWQARNGKGWRG
jgi:hypothetical protein